jgi:hypothetical protein
MIHIGITGMRDTVKMLDEGEVVAVELQKICLQMEVETDDSSNGGGPLRGDPQDNRRWPYYSSAIS